MRIIPTIETMCGSTIRTACHDVIECAGLGVLRGPPGIGKTYAMAPVMDDLEARGVRIVHVTASPATGGSVNAFLRSILAQYRIEAGSTLDSLEALADIVAGYPFRDGGLRVLMVIDEAQELKPTVLETIRSIWDRGDSAREGLVSGPAFGWVMLGNQTFLGKGGNVRQASFLPLTSRVTHNFILPRPDREEYAALAAAAFPDQPDLQAELAEFGALTANLRSMAGAARQARMITKGEAVTLPVLKTAQRLVWGK